jgi:glycosyltransferase involved in cell wall biosynthesis
MGISVIVPTYNNTKFIEECINSIYESGLDREYELLIGVDACEDTMDFLKQLKLNDNTRVFFFLKNGGPYIIKNTLSKIAKYDKILFFDSDDIMRPVMISVAEDGLDKFTVVRPMMINFRVLNGKKVLDNKRKWGEGVFAIKKELFLTLNGFEGWRVAADSDFIGRLVKNRARIWSTQEPLFDRRVHANSLTMSRETGFNSDLRSNFARISREKKYFGPLPSLATGEYMEAILDKIQIEDLKNMLLNDEDRIRLEEYKKKKKMIADILSNENIKPKISKYNQPDYDEINNNLIKRNTTKNFTNDALKKVFHMDKKTPKIVAGKIIR